MMLLLVALLGGPAMAWAVYQPGSRRAYDRDVAKFQAGNGRDPSKRIFGPNRSFAHNAIIAGGIIFIIGFVITKLMR